MHRLKRSFLALLIAVAALAQTASEKPSVDVRRVGARLKCQCGCPDSVATCSMLECHFSKPAKEKIAQMQAAGRSDQDIVQDFVKQFGAVVFLAEPNALGWLVPYTCAFAGLLIVLAVLKSYRRPRPIAAPAPVDLDDPALAKYKDQIERDLANLD